MLKTELFMNPRIQSVAAMTPTASAPSTDSRIGRRIKLSYLRLIRRLGKMRRRFSETLQVQAEESARMEDQLERLKMRHYDRYGFTMRPYF